MYETPELKTTKVTLIASGSSYVRNFIDTFSSYSMLPSVMSISVNLRTAANVCNKMLCISCAT